MSPFPGAVTITFATPFDFRCSPRPAASRQMPLLSMSRASSMPYRV